MRPFTNLLPLKLAIVFGSNLIPLLFELGTKISTAPSNKEVSHTLSAA